VEREVRRLLVRLQLRRVEQVPRDGDTFAHKYEPNAADGVN
jgi:hypothetical protein